MKYRFRIAFLCASMPALAACATAPAAAPEPVTPMAEPAFAPAPEKSAHDRLFELFKASDEASLQRNPLNAIFRGDLRYADRLGDSITDEYYAAEKAAAEADLSALHAIPRDQLDATDQIAYDTFEYTTRDALRGYQPDILSLTKVRPLNHFYGLHTFYPTFASGQGGAPFNTVQDYENNLKRHRDFVVYIDRALGRFKEGQAASVVETKMTVRNMIEQLNSQLNMKPEDSPYFGPAKDFPEAIAAPDRERLTQSLRAAITDEIYPALARLRDYLKNDYLASARDGYGLMYMKGGDHLYRYQIQSTTTLPMTPEEIHDIGLREVARIRAEMEKIRQEVGFKGSLHQFFEHLRTAKQFQPKSRDALTQAYYAIGKEVDAKIPQYFSVVPKTKLEIRPYEPFREKFEAGGSYEQGTPDGSRPGTFYFNAYDLPAHLHAGKECSRPTGCATI